eukprot:5326314-Prymnesium_polylepis.3
MRDLRVRGFAHVTRAHGSRRVVSRNVSDLSSCSCTALQLAVTRVTRDSKMEVEDAAGGDDETSLGLAGASGAARGGMEQT